MTAWPATVTVPVLADPSVASTRKLATPEPVPLLPLVTEIQGVLLATAQGQPGAVDTGTSTGPPADPTLTAALPTLTLHPTP